MQPKPRPSTPYEFARRKILEAKDQATRRQWLAWHKGKVKPEQKPVTSPHQRLLEELASLGIQNIFRRLPLLPENGLPKSSLSEKVRLFEFEGRRYVIKDTQGSETQGARYQTLRAVFWKHQRLIREKKITPKNYLLRSIKVIGIIDGRYLVMPYIEGTPFLGPAEIPKSLNEAYNEMDNNIQIAKKGISFLMPQTPDMIYRKTFKKGKPLYVFYLPYDYL